MKKTLKNKGQTLKLTTLGFTLIELLAVIVILAVIALIATPLIMNVIDDAKKGAFSDSMHGIVESAELYTSRLLTKDPTNISRTVHFDGTTNDLNLSGEQPKNGILFINKNGEIQFTIPSNNQKWCAKKSYETDKITISDYAGSDCTDYHTVKDYSNKKMDGHNYGVKIENGEAHFDGASYMSAGYANYDFKNQITLGVRFYYPGDNAANYIVGNWEDGGGGIVSYSTVGSDRIQLELYVNGTYQIIKIPGLTKNQYHTVIMTYNGSKMEGYVDGALVGSLTFTGNIKKSTVPIAVGANPQPFSHVAGWFGQSKTKMTDVILMNRAVTSSEVTTNFKDEVKLLNDDSVLFQYKF